MLLISQKVNNNNLVVRRINNNRIPLLKSILLALITASILVIMIHQSNMNHNSHPNEETILTKKSIAVGKNNEQHLLMVPIERRDQLSEHQQQLTKIDDNSSIRSPHPSLKLPFLEKHINITSSDNDFSHLLDFAIVGIAKCGTTTMMHWLSSHTSEIRCYKQEMGWELNKKQPTKFISNTLLPVYNNNDKNQNKQNNNNHNYKIGYKNPTHIELMHVRNYFRTIFTNTKLIIGIRHPVRWFESMYNYRIVQQQQDDDSTTLIMPNPKELIGSKCHYNNTGNCCTDRTNFANAFIRLGKQYLVVVKDDNNDHHTTNTSTITVRQNISIQRRQPTQLELEILQNPNTAYENNNNTNNSNSNDIIDIEPVLNPVFIYEMNQLKDDNVTRSDQFRMDIQRFLSLKHRLPSIIHVIPKNRKKKKRIEYSEAKRPEERTHQFKKINICDNEYTNVRIELMKHARRNSIWIRDVFINSPTVHVSSKENFISQLKQWMIDPCTDGTTTTD